MGQLLIGGGLFHRFLAFHQFHVQTERLQLADQDVERFGHARLDAGFTLHDGLVNFCTTIDVVRFRGQQFLQDVRRAVGLERPNFHFAEALAAELGLAAERLLRDERIRSDRTRVDLVVDQVRQLQHVDVTDGDLLRELLAGHAVPQRDLAGMGQSGHFEQVADLRFARAVKYRRGHGNAFAEAVGVFEQRFVVEIHQRLPDGGVGENLAEPAADGLRFPVLVEQSPDTAAEFLGGPSEMGLEDLADVHTGRNAQRVEHHFHGSTVGQIRHVRFRNDARDHTLVAVAAGHFVADREFSLHGDVALHQFDDPGRQLVAFSKLFLALLGNLPEDIDLTRGHLLDFVDFFDEQRILVGEFQPLQVPGGDFLDDVAGELGALGDQAFVGFLVVQVGRQFLAVEQRGEPLQALVGQDADFVGQVFLQFENLGGFDRLMAFIFFRALAAEDLDVDDGALNARRAIERSIANIAGLLPEDGAQEFFFRRQRGFALGGDFANQDVAGTHGGANADDAAFIEVAEEHLADIGNIAGDFLWAELGVTRLDFVFFNVDGGVVVVLDQLFADQDGVLEVVAAPREERDQNVAAQRQFAALGARSVGQHLALADAVTDADERLLVDARILVRPLEFDELVDVSADFAGEHTGVVGLDVHDDAFGVHLVHDSVAAADDHSARIASGDAFHAGADQRGFSADQRHGLALHVGTHQRAVGVVVFEEWNQARRNRDQLFRRNVDVVHFLALFQDEVSGLPAVDQLGRDAAALIEGGVGLRDDVAVLFPCREVETVGVEGNLAALEFLVDRFDFVAFDDFARLEFAFTSVDDKRVIDHAPAFDLAVGRFDEAELVDPRVARKRADQTNVRAFRRLNRADAAIVRRMDVADLESGALARQPARPESGQAALVGDFAERIGLIHELRKLRTAEKFADRGHNRLGVDQIVRQGGGHFLVHRHLFLDGALHADQADAELVLEELAHRAHAAIAQMIDVVHRADVLAQFQ